MLLVMLVSPTQFMLLPSPLPVTLTPPTLGSAPTTSELLSPVARRRGRLMLRLTPLSSMEDMLPILDSDMLLDMLVSPTQSTLLPSPLQCWSLHQLPRSCCPLLDSELRVMSRHLNHHSVHQNHLLTSISVSLATWSSDFKETFCFFSFSTFSIKNSKIA